MVTRLRWTLSLLALPAGACGSHAPPEPVAPVTVEGNPADVRALAGQWQGEYIDPSNQRSGKIEFHLPPEGTTGYGSVTFTTPQAVPICSELTRSQPAPSEPVPTVLRIARLAVDRGSISGSLAPYRDEQRRCWVDTWFEGRLIRDRLEGTFFAHPTATDTVRAGTWWATRSS
jgi:hypothetical protein